MLSSVTSSILFLSLLWTSQAHMEMSNPLPMRSSLDPSVPERLMDYNLKSPLTTNGSNYPCHGYQNERPIASKATYVAGKTYTMTIAGSASHGGGSCQLSLSYDNGGTFKVIKSMIGGCPLTSKYDFTVPSFAPSGNALFAWTWFNEIGNREMYMNCAWVTIAGSSSARRKAKRQSTFTSMSSLPNIWRANIAGLSSCTTPEGTDPKFPNPGPDVIYAGGLSASSPATAGSCDAATPQGQTFQASSDTGSTGGGAAASVAVSSVPSSPSTSSTASSSTAATSSVVSGGVFAEDSPSSAASEALASPSIEASSAALSSSIPISASASQASSSTSTSDAPSLSSSSSLDSSTGSSSDSSSNASPSSAQQDSPVSSSQATSSAIPSTSATATGSASTVSAMMTEDCDTPPEMTETSPVITMTTETSTAAQTTVAGETINTMVPVVGAEGAAPGASEPAQSSASFVGDSDIGLYLPCVAGSFLCLSATQYFICDQSVIGIPFSPVMQYVGPRPVAPGMACLPHLSPLPDLEKATRMSNSSAAANVPDGYFRSDRYVLA